LRRCFLSAEAAAVGQFSSERAFVFDPLPTSLTCSRSNPSLHFLVTATSGSVSNSASVTPPTGISDPNTGDNQTIDSGTVNPGNGGGRGSAQPIPTLDARALVLLAISMALMGAWLARRRRSSAWSDRS
jgi:exosortase sorting signal-containing protein